MDVIMTGYAGLSASKEMAQQEEAFLRQTLSHSFLQSLQSIPEEGEPLSFQPVYWEPVERGGVFEALWNLAEQAQTGLQAELARIPIRQETIEVCERLDQNPYQLPSGGILYLAENGNGLPGTVIGRTHKAKARTIVGYEGVRYLDKPRHGKPEEETSDVDPV